MGPHHLANDRAFTGDCRYDAGEAAFVANVGCLVAPVTKAAILNATDFFDGALCSRVFIPPSQDGLVPVQKTVEWLDIPCEQFGSDRLDQFRRAVAANLSHFGVRAGDVVISRSGSAVHDLRAEIRRAWSVGRNLTRGVPRGEFGP